MAKARRRSPKPAAKSVPEPKSSGAKGAKAAAAAKPAKPAVAPSAAAASKPAAGSRASTKTATRRASAGQAPAKAATKAGPRGKRRPTAYDPEYERPLSELPPLTFPNSEQNEFRVAAETRRRTRVRNESIFGGILVVAGMGGLVAAHTPAFLALAAIAGVAMVAYELMVSGLE